MKTKHLTTTAVALALLALPTVAQDEGPPIEITPVQEEEPPLIEALNAPPTPQDEMGELFRRVEVRLREIDDLLNDASAGETSALENVGESGIDDLLQNSMSRGREVVKDIDRILEIAAQNGGT